jgi:hypothetical protein
MGRLRRRLLKRLLDRLVIHAGDGDHLDDPSCRLPLRVRVLFAGCRREGSLLGGGVKGGVKGGVLDRGRRWQEVADRETTQPHNLQKRREAEGFATSCL